MIFKHILDGFPILHTTCSLSTMWYKIRPRHGLHLSRCSLFYLDFMKCRPRLCPGYHRGNVRLMECSQLHWDINWNSSACISTYDIYKRYINGLVQERRNSSALAMELRLSCTNPSIYSAKNKARPSVFHYITFFIFFLFEIYLISWNIQYK